MFEKEQEDLNISGHQFPITGPDVLYCMKLQVIQKGDGG